MAIRQNFKLNDFDWHITIYYTVNDEIGKFMFYCCANLKEIELPDGVTSIGDYAFYCDALTSIDIPDNVTSIGNDTFSYCDALTTVTIGDGVTSIGYGVFSECSALRDFYCHATTPPSIRSSSFSTYDDQTTLHVPAGCGSTYKSRWGYHFKNIVEMD